MICAACNYESAIPVYRNGKRVCVCCGTPEGDERAEHLAALVRDGNEEAHVDLFHEFPRRQHAS
jgi:hypothetical protein